MEWYAYIAYFFAGVFLANGAPHFVEGITARRFQTPFATPPGVGESPPVVNVIWGMINFAIGYVLIFGVGDFVFGMNRGALMVGVGALIMAIALAVYFGRLRGN